MAVATPAAEASRRRLDVSVAVRCIRHASAPLGAPLERPEGIHMEKPSGKLIKNYGKSLFSIGKSTTNIYKMIFLWPFSIVNLAWSKLILNDYPVYGLAVYGLARGPGHRFHIKYLKLMVLGPSFFQSAFTFRPQQIQTPGKQKSGRKCLKDLKRGLAVDLPE